MNKGITYQILKYTLYTFSHIFSDKLFIQWKFRLCMGYTLDLDHPQTFNEKLQWLKLHDRKIEYTRMVDKAEVKKYVANIIGEDYLIPTLGVYDKPEDIDFDVLPNQFVLKTTHDSGGVFICRNKSTFDKESAIRKLKKRLKRNVFWYTREWPYKNVKPRIIAEKYIGDEINGELRDYKYFCFNGKVKALFIASDRMKKGEETKFDFFDENFNHLPFINGHPNAEVTPQKPVHFEEMKKLAGKLSNGIPHVRVDFYEVNNKVYFGEMTFFHWSGFTPFVPEVWDKKFGELLNL